VVLGREHLSPGRAMVFCANHQSNVDPPVLFRVLHPRLHVLYKAELSKLPLLGRVIRLGGFVAVDRENREAALASIAQGAQSLRDGNSFLIFPEGTRSRTPQLLPFKKGGFIMALQANVPVVPVAIHGGRAAMRRGSKLVWPARVVVRVGAPIDTAGLTLDDRDRLIGQVRDEVQRMLDETSARGKPNGR
jgi:1-acyl-sn-glycerol-3-phosphate acyltransferase